MNAMLSVGGKECHYCQSTTVEDREGASPVGAYWVITRAVFGMPQRIVVCWRKGCTAKAEAEGYKFQGYGK